MDNMGGNPPRQNLKNIHADTRRVLEQSFCGNDPEFGDCVDGFVLADLAKLKARKRKRYLGDAQLSCTPELSATGDLDQRHAGSLHHVHRVAEMSAPPNLAGRT